MTTPGSLPAPRTYGNWRRPSSAGLGSLGSLGTAVLLVGLVLNSALGWSWADPVAALVIAAMAVKEGRQAWRGDACCAPVAALQQDEAGRARDDQSGRAGHAGCCPPSVSGVASAPDAAPSPPAGLPALSVLPPGAQRSSRPTAGGPPACACCAVAPAAVTLREPTR